jgi:hypothetical protein
VKQIPVSPTGWLINGFAVDNAGENVYVGTSINSQNGNYTYYYNTVTGQNGIFAGSAAATGLSVANGTAPQAVFAALPALAQVGYSYGAASDGISRL